MIDREGRSIQVGKEIGRGGEGSIFEIAGDDALVAKVYHKKPLPEDQVAKLEAMAECWTNMLGSIAAWPKSMLYDSAANKRPCGFLMPKMVGARQLHELYGTTNRRAHFPDAQWHHLVLAARNTAAAFDTLHKFDIVVGDVNQGNVLVDTRMCVRLIDCDSFQITSGGKTFPCPVGTPHFTPPELQALKLREITRTINHDRFGLAILIFHLLFVGRHPFAGRFRGPGDLTIERAIAEHRFAFSKNVAETLVDPPPASLRTGDLPAGVAELFERAFHKDGNVGASRPSAEQWVQELDQLIKQRTTCKFEPAHVHYSGLRECPWCRVEDEGGPSFFVASGATSRLSPERMMSLDARLHRLGSYSFPDLTNRRVQLPQKLARKKVKGAGLTKADVAAGLLAAAGVACAAGVVYPQALVAGAALSLASGAYLLFGKEGQERRKTVADYQSQLVKIEETFQKTAHKIVTKYLKRKAEFERSTADFNREFEIYHAQGDQLKEVLRTHRMTKKDDFLRKFLIRDHYKQIPGMSPSLVVMLESFGVETAVDLDKLNLLGVPVIDSEMELELLQWRSQMEQKFVFRPDHGVTVQDLKGAEQIATQRFKIMQARRVLIAASRLQGESEVATSELNKDLAKLDAIAEQWREVANPLRDFQSRRSKLEYLLNHSPWTVAGIAAGVPLVCYLLHLMFG